MTLPNWATSSADPSQISLSVESAGKSLVGIVALYATYKGLDSQVVTSHFLQFVDTVSTGAAAAYTTYHSVQLVYGLVRKAFIKLFGQQAADATTPSQAL